MEDFDVFLEMLKDFTKKLNDEINEDLMDDESYRESYMDGLRHGEESEDFKPFNTESGDVINLKPWEQHLHHDENGNIWSVNPTTGVARKKQYGTTNIQDFDSQVANDAAQVHRKLFK